mmetsp:Transcript_23347/g.65574  ORF Transcript_23347/g.65574 Transcript_23347/m.65574 type:complete len:486 (+) Transcript_23347:101-1558(+)|eukprot:CAMPEP_0119145274 /NCGR_PEP_ID=MMETSP1310-20130426/37264_1 /TAXON_ID=464262 /ORGANISM="Genus nov. species nov., Strain RCC2339" /LENGTH=485 /DNA_ID=CAMNT_0007137081 /DNA_START=55 /DNA_END=1509 /DNA_ORIENTATION=+
MDGDGGYDIYEEDGGVIEYERTIFGFPRNRVFLGVGIITAVGILIIGVSILTFYLVKDKQDDRFDPTVIIISLDGFRAEYWAEDERLYPNIADLYQTGQRAVLEPVFPTLTFPNHYAIATGLFAPWNGIMNNVFYDSSLDDVFNAFVPESSHDPVWWFGQPTWNTAIYQGLRSATYFWPGSDVAINDTRPTYWYPYDESVPYQDRATQVLEWLALPYDKRPQLIYMYFDTPDHQGHDHGPDSVEVKAGITEVDAVIGYLMDGLEDMASSSSPNLASAVHILVVSDHGMAATPPSNVIDVDTLGIVLGTSDDWTETQGVPQGDQQGWGMSWGAVLTVLPASEQDAIDIIAKLSIPNANWTVYTNSSETPERWHYCCSDRIAPITAVADVSYQFHSTMLFGNETSLGNHGYDNGEPDMQAIYVANGPRIVRSSEQNDYYTRPLQNVDIVRIICDIIGLEEPPNNSSLGLVDLRQYYVSPERLNTTAL